MHRGGGWKLPDGFVFSGHKNKKCTVLRVQFDLRPKKLIMILIKYKFFKQLLRIDFQYGCLML